MISSDDYHHPPPDPSSSQHHNQQKSHEKDHVCVPDTDLFKYLAADLDDINNSLIPSFCIRDYVFDSRNKDIGCNWPFSHKTLQICLKHGVKNLLPPFQSLESLRDEEITSNNDENPNVNEFVSITCNGTNLNPLESRNKESQTHTNSKKPALVSSRKTENKSKIGSKSNNTSVEEVTPNSLIMAASKVCPVCKTFTSSSNTTLNAHIDQCLSGESSMKWTAKPKVTVKHKIKPRKMRLMLDVYKTAPHCTVEELDARNGTSWANSSSFPAQELEFQGEKEKEGCAATAIVPEVADHEEGEVYIDTNGTKVRILSVPKVDASDDHGARKLLKREKMSKLLTMKKKKNKNHEHKYLKRSPNNKKLCSLKPHHGASSEMTNVGIKESCNKEDRGEEPMESDLPVVVRPPWACSKRTGLAKKLDGVVRNKSFSERGLRTPSNPFKKIETLSPKDRHNAIGHLKKKPSLFHTTNEDSRPCKHLNGSKFNLKRKLSALKKSYAHPLSKENVFVGPSQDSLKQQYRVEEQDRSGKTSSESKNLLQVKKNKKTDIMDPSFDVESVVGKDQVSCMVLKNSLNLEFLKPIADVTDDIDGVPIVEPPGSFLPSYVGDMVYEDVHGNSSLATASRDSMSGSPISTISNPSLLARSDSDKFSVRSTRALKDAAPITNSSDDDWRSILPCCCSRKEGGVASSSSYHESSLFRKDDIESLNLRPRVFSFSNYLTSQPPVQASPSTMKFPADSVGSPSSKPVLRLMGKNLTVVKTDEDVSSQFPNYVQNDYRPIIFSPNQNGFRSDQHPAFQPSNNFTNHASDTYAGCYVHKSPNLIPQNRNGFDGQMVSEKNMHKVPSNPVKEIIVIDDSTEDEGNHDACAMHTRRNWASLHYQSQNSLPFSKGNFQAFSPFVANNGNLGKWNCTPPAAAAAAGSSRSHMKSSAVYYSPS